MSKIPYCDTQGNLSVIVELQHPADVYLIDPSNLKKKQRGQRFNYYGGHYNENPVRISVNKSGRWYLIVEGSNYKYNFYN